MRLRYSAAARSQLDDIGDYIAQHDPVAAQQVLWRIRAAAERLRRFPYMGRSGREPGTFEWPVRGLPYIIVYEVFVDDEDEVMVLNVFHGAQDR